MKLTDGSCSQSLVHFLILPQPCNVLNKNKTRLKYYCGCWSPRPKSFKTTEAFGWNSMLQLRFSIYLKACFYNLSTVFNLIVSPNMLSFSVPLITLAVNQSTPKQNVKFIYLQYFKSYFFFFQSSHKQNSINTAIIFWIVRNLRIFPWNHKQTMLC